MKVLIVPHLSGEATDSHRFALDPLNRTCRRFPSRELRIRGEVPTVDHFVAKPVRMEASADLPRRIAIVCWPQAIAAYRRPLCDGLWWSVDALPGAVMRGGVS